MSDRSHRKNKIVSPSSIADEAAGDSSAESDARVGPNDESLLQPEHDVFDNEVKWIGQGSLKRGRAASTLRTKRLKSFEDSHSINEIRNEVSSSNLLPSPSVQQKKQFQTKDEIARHELRKEQNRRAAIISRGRKKVLLNELNNTVDAFTKANKSLKEQNEELELLLKKAQACIGMLKEDDSDPDADGRNLQTTQTPLYLAERRTNLTSIQLGHDSTGSSSNSRSNRINFPLPPIGTSMDAMMNFQVAASAQVEEAMKNITYSKESSFEPTLSRGTSSSVPDGNLKNKNLGSANLALDSSYSSSNLNTNSIVDGISEPRSRSTSMIPETMSAQFGEFGQKRETLPQHSSPRNLAEQQGLDRFGTNINNVHLGLLSALLVNTMQQRSSQDSAQLARTEDQPLNFLQQTHQLLSQQIQADYVQVQSQQNLLQERNQEFLELLLRYQFQQNHGQQQHGQGDRR